MNNVRINDWKLSSSEWISEMESTMKSKYASAVIFAAVLCISGNLLAYSGGSGTAGRPYQISNVMDWQELMTTTTDWNKCFILRDNINLGEITLTPIGNLSNNFTGVLDGGHYIISHAYFKQAINYVGLFGCVGTSGQIRNLGVDNASMTGGDYVGGLAGANLGTLTACYATGRVDGATYVGGLVGSNTGSLTDCHAAGSVDGTGNFIGGLVGTTGGGGSALTNCYATGAVSGANTYAGGLAGYNGFGTLTNCYATGSVGGISNVGGLVGQNYSGAIISCYAYGLVTGTSDVGGLAGKNWGGTLTTCSATGLVTGSTDIGGLVGTNGGILSDCHATGPVNGTGYGAGGVGGLTGRHDGGTISKCYSTGNVTSGPNTPYLGGLTGVNSGAINNCYSTGNAAGGVSSSYLGGLVGVNSSLGTLTACFATGAAGGASYVGGLVGSNTGVVTGCFWDTQTSGQTTSAGGTGETTVQMKTLSTFTLAGWDFVNMWGIIGNQTYPYLRTQPSADSNSDGRVDLADFAIFASQWLAGI
jgi:hypothetical protein